jgi:hypothetical protein
MSQKMYAEELAKVRAGKEEHTKQKERLNARNEQRYIEKSRNRE